MQECHFISYITIFESHKTCIYTNNCVFHTKFPILSGCFRYSKILVFFYKPYLQLNCKTNRILDVFFLFLFRWKISTGGGRSLVERELIPLDIDDHYH